MFIKQLSIFVENKFGRLEAIIDTIGKNGVNIRALSIADTTDFGILRVIVDDTEKAKKCLSDAGVVAKATDVIAVYIDDETGGLAKVLGYLTEEKISVEYMYAFLSRDTSKALMVVKADDEEAAEKALRLKGVEMLNPENL
ncbi:MAG: amino acid-binding protein [Clostridia bacterium]|nr:amino acid-binding protein [Clostridia bacterium]MBQ7897837.1 amino acid-binding protein [Clostridia bacterium]